MTTKPPVFLATYEFNIRSFHPEKDFGWSGLFFGGDNRGFSLQPSGTGDPTSRIWHRFKLDAFAGRWTDPATRSDPSQAGWSDKPQKYDAELSPKGIILPVHKTVRGNVVNLRVNGSYHGENHAMPGSAALQKETGMTYVPSLNVRYQLWVTIDRTAPHMDLVLYVTGDGFPNCEAFVVDPRGKTVFLGIHVRKGAAPVTLTLNADYPMIACAIRLPLDLGGGFLGSVGDELQRRHEHGAGARYQPISVWNQRFLAGNPNRNHMMVLEDFKHALALR